MTLEKICEFLILVFIVVFPFYVIDKYKFWGFLFCVFTEYCLAAFQRWTIVLKDPLGNHFGFTLWLILGLPLSFIYCLLVYTLIIVAKRIVEDLSSLGIAPAPVSVPTLTPTPPAPSGRPITPAWLKMIKLLPRYIHLSVLRTSEFKFNFYTYLLLYVLHILLFLFFWRAANLPPVAGWQTPHYILLTAFSAINFALQEFLWSTAILDELILDGDLLVVLSRPVNSYFGLVLRRCGAMSVLAVIMGGVLLMTTLLRYKLDTDGWRMLGALSACLLAAVAFRGGLVVVGALSFRIGRVGFLKSFFFGAREFSKLSLSILNPMVSSFLTLALPAMLIATWPVLILNLASPAVALSLWTATLLLTVFWTSLAAWAWTRGLRHYEGTGRWG